MQATINTAMANLNFGYIDWSTDIVTVNNPSSEKKIYPYLERDFFLTVNGHSPEYRGTLTDLSNIVLEKLKEGAKSVLIWPTTRTTVKAGHHFTKSDIQLPQTEIIDLLKKLANMCKYRHF